MFPTAAGPGLGWAQSHSLVPIAVYEQTEGYNSQVMAIQILVNYQDKGDYDGQANRAAPEIRLSITLSFPCWEIQTDPVG